MNNKAAIYEKLLSLMEESDIRNHEFYPDFRRLWTEVFRLALASDTVYFPIDSPEVLTVPCAAFDALELDFHINQVKIHEWYVKELGSKKKVVFEAKRFARSRKLGIHYDRIPCYHDPKLPEEALTERMRNIVACAFPGRTPDLRIVYGNKWISEKFNILLQSKISLFLIRTDYVPAFLADPFEVCAYLFLMDYCIIKEDTPKVKDTDLKRILHIFRPSPMLMVKGLINNKK